MNKALRWLRRLRPALTLEVVFPALMGLLIFVVFTTIMLSGGRRESLAARVEKRLLESSLRMAAYDSLSPGAVVTVTLSDADLRQLRPAPSPLIRDAHLSEYARVLSRIAAMRPSLVVISWLQSAHPSDAEYWAPLVRALSEAPEPWNVIIAYPISRISEVPAAVKRDFQVMESEDCVYDINSYCTYNQIWTTWLIQALANRLWQDPPPNHVSVNLPHVLPNFILNLPRRRSIPDVSFTDVLSGSADAGTFKDRVVFIGNDTQQDQLFKNNKTVLRRTYTAESLAGAGSLLEHGTPLHQFWAQLAQMLVDRTTIAVAPRGASVGVLLAMSLLILGTMYKAGQAASVALLLAVVIAAPVLNALSMRLAFTYLPLFPVAFGGFLVYVFSAFGLMSYHNFRRWKLEAERRSYALTADMKGNFISLISHNLNTPIAKLLGLIDVLAAPGHLTATGALQECRRLVTMMQFFAKSALLSTSLEQQGRTPARANAKALLHEFSQSYVPLLRRLGLEFKIAPAADDVLFAPLAVDPRTCAHALAAMALLVAGDAGGDLRCDITLQDDAGPGRHALRLAVLAASAAAATRDLPALFREPGGGGDTGDTGGGQDSILAQYVQTVANAYDAVLSVDVPAGGGARVILALPLPG